MSTPRVQKFGAGVQVSTLPDASVLVRSERLRLPWAARSGRAVGTAVLLGLALRPLLARLLAPSP